MNNKSILMNAILAASLLQYSSLSRSDDSLPTHCMPNEFAILNAKMYKVGDNGLVIKNTEKILSLCADKNEEPFGKFVYRYGLIGKVEMEQIATIADPFGLSEESDPIAHAGRVSVSFRKGSYTYVVSEGMGMDMSGILLSIYKSGKKILTLSSNENHYDSNMAGMDFEKAPSPIFRIVKPIEPVW